jgi:hypothetical protein
MKRLSSAVMLAGLCLSNTAPAIRAQRARAPDVSRSSDAARKRFVGNWKLVSYQAFSESGEARTLDYDGGRIMYDDRGYMAAQLMRSGRAKSAPATDEERAAAYRGYTAYYGTYEIDEAKGVVMHHVEGALSPQWPGTTLVRSYAFSEDGKRLTLSIKTGDRITGTLTWERL